MSQSSPGRREVAYRLFATEFDDAEFSYSESDEERAPNYVVTPTGARVNRLFAVGVLTAVESVNPEMVRGRVVDPTGAFVTYAGQYQPDELAYLERADPPTFLALSGKARTFEPEDGDRVFTSVRPESVSEVDADTRDRWVVTTAERTLERVGVVASAIESELAGDRLRVALENAGVDERLADGVALALEYYDTTPDYLEALRETALQAVEVVAGERDEAESPTLAPGDGGGDPSALASLELAEPEMPESEATAAPAGADEPAEVPGDGAGATAGGDEEVSDGTPASETGDEVDSADETAVSSSSAGEPVADVDESAEESAAESATGAVDEEAPAAEESPTGTDTAVADDAEDDPGAFELDEEERAEVEEEYGTEFSTAGEVDDVDPDGVDTEASDDGSASAAGSIDAASETDVAEVDDAADSDAPDETDADPVDAVDEPAADDTESPDDVSEIDLENAVVETMEDLDDGDGADREALVASVADQYGVATDEVEEAIQDALMSGRCYEPTDGTLKSI